MLGQSIFVLAPLVVVLSGRWSWDFIGLSRRGLASSLALGALLALIVVIPTEVAPYLLGYDTPVFQITDPSRYLGVPLAVLLYLPFWGIFESVWLCYLIYAINRWLTGGSDLSWRALLLAALWFGLLHAFTQLLAFGAPLPQVLDSMVIGLALLIPGTIPKFTGNAWGLITVTNF
ncbi:MAG: hypothetical protein M3P37_12735 [Actinomycetota bacterium]|nr:hypothetical protein [Actinomycetota bacterium]